MNNDVSQELAQESRGSLGSEEASETESTVDIPPRAEPPRWGFDERQVVLARRRMQQQRKALFAEIQPMRIAAAERQAAAARKPVAQRRSSGAGMSASYPLPAKPLSSGTQEFGRTMTDKAVASSASPTGGGGGSAPNRRAPTYVAKVERFHRHMIRKEVWGQKFNFLYRQVQQEIEGEEHEDNLTGTIGSAGGATSMSVMGLAPSRRRTQTHTPNTSLPPTPSAPSLSARRKVSTPMHTTPQPLAEQLPLVPAEMAPAVQARSVRPSTSLPSLIINQHLCVVRQEYYGGDELLMHEDILHSSNPRLFPLRPVPGQSFAATNLPALLAY